MAHAVQKVVQRCEDCENNGGSMGKNYYLSIILCNQKSVCLRIGFLWNVRIRMQQQVLSYHVKSVKTFDIKEDVLQSFNVVNNSNFDSFHLFSSFKVVFK